jgi:hypothetical protein
LGSDADLPIRAGEVLVSAPPAGQLVPMIFYAGSIIRIKKAGAHPSLDREVVVHVLEATPAQRRNPTEPVKCNGETIGVRDENIDVEVCSPSKKAGWAAWRDT